MKRNSQTHVFCLFFLIFLPTCQMPYPNKMLVSNWSPGLHTHTHTHMQLQEGIKYDSCNRSLCGLSPPSDSYQNCKCIIHFWTICLTVSEFLPYSLLYEQQLTSSFMFHRYSLIVRSVFLLITLEAWLNTLKKNIFCLDSLIK